MKIKNTVVLRDLDFINSNLKEFSCKLNGASVLMTGCGGFLGFYMMQYLVMYARILGIKKVIGLDNFILEKPKWLENLEEEYPDVLTIHSFDIAKDSVSSVEGADSVDFVIHAASIASPVFYRKHPLATLDANIWGLRELLDFYNNDSLKGFLFFSSSEIYGDPASDMIPTDEEYHGYVSCHGPRACYDESKRFGETMCWVYADQFGMPITIARPFNNFGPGMRLGDRRLPADFAKAVMNEQDINILSDGKPTRTFCYVADAVVGYFLCLLYGKYDYFNIGTEGPEISVRDVAKAYVEIAAAVLNFDLNVKFKTSDDGDYMTNNPNRRCPNIHKARSLLKYDPKINLRDGINRYISFLNEEGAK